MKLNFLPVITGVQVLCLLAAVPHALQAQTSFGLHGGVNLTQMDFTRNPEYRTIDVQLRQGFQAGIFYRLMTQQHTGIAFELNYSQQGWNEGPDAEGLRYQRQIDYVTLPVLTHFNIGKERFRFLIELGPYAGYAINSTEYFIDDNTGTSESRPYEYLEDRDNRIDFGLTGGVGFEYHLGPLAIHAVGRYGYGFGNVFKKRGDAAELSQNRVISILGGVAIPFRRPEFKPRTDQP